MGLDLKRLSRHGALTPRVFARLMRKEKFLSDRLQIVKKLLRKPVLKN